MWLYSSTVASPSSLAAAAQRVEPLAVVVADGVGPAGEVVERVAVGGEREPHAVEAGHLVEALEELVERVGAGDEAGDVRA